MATMKRDEDRQDRLPAADIHCHLPVPAEAASNRGTLWSCAKTKTLRSRSETHDSRAGGLHWTYTIEGCITVVEQDREPSRVRREVRVGRGPGGSGVKYALTRRTPINGQTVVVSLVANICCLGPKPELDPGFGQCRSSEGEALSHD